MRCYYFHYSRVFELVLASGVDSEGVAERAIVVVRAAEARRLNLKYYVYDVVTETIILCQYYYMQASRAVRPYEPVSDAETHQDSYTRMTRVARHQQHGTCTEASLTPFQGLTSLTSHSLVIQSNGEISFVLLGLALLLFCFVLFSLLNLIPITVKYVSQQSGQTQFGSDRVSGKLSSRKGAYVVEVRIRVTASAPYYPENLRADARQNYYVERKRREEAQGSKPNSGIRGPRLEQTQLSSSD